LTQECIIRRQLAERDAEIRTITQRNLSLENSTLAAKDVIKTQEAVINRLNNDNGDLILKAVETDRTVKSLKDEVDERNTSYESSLNVSYPWKKPHWRRRMLSRKRMHSSRVSTTTKRI
jgi:hypothetical protein